MATKERIERERSLLVNRMNLGVIVTPTIAVRYRRVPAHSNHGPLICGLPT